MRIIEKTGTSLVLESEETAQRLAEDTKQLLEYVKQVGTRITHYWFIAWEI